AGLFELGLDLLGLILWDTFFQRLGCALNEVLRFLEAETGDHANLFDHVDLLLAEGGEHDGKLGFLLDGCRRARARRSRNRDRGGGGDAPLLFQHFGKVSGLKHGELRGFVEYFLQISHWTSLW